jgi:uncharacterized cupredoxin-like copper-binding protein
MKLFRIAALAAAAALSVSAFAKDPHHDHHGHGMSPEMKAKHDALEAKLMDTGAFGVKGDPKKATRTVALNASDIAFDVKSIDVKVGETVKFVVENKGDMTHEFTIGDEAYQKNARAMMTMMTEMGMDPSSPEHAKMHAGMANTAVVLPMEIKTIAWTFTKPGSFVFACNMIGHSEAGMKGKITVK